MQTLPPVAKLVESPDVAKVQLPLTVQECHAVITQQAQQLAELASKVQVLQERINLDSNNSSKPPSSNGPGHLNRAQRRASGRKRGAQPGHKGQ
jgi:transposase